MTKEERAEQKRIEAEKQQLLAQEFVNKYNELVETYGFMFEAQPIIDAEGKIKAQIQIKVV